MNFTILKDFTVTFDEYNAYVMNKSINFFQKTNTFTMWNNNNNNKNTYNEHQQKTQPLTVSKAV